MTPKPAKVHSSEAELALIGSLLMAEELNRPDITPGYGLDLLALFAEVKRILSPQDFFDESRQRIYEAICSLPVESVDIVTVGRVLVERGQYTDQTSEDLREAVEGAWFPRHAPYYAGIIHKLAERRAQLNTAQALARSAMTDPRRPVFRGGIDL